MDSAVVNDGVEDFHISIMLVILLQFVYGGNHFPPGFVNLICKPPFAKASIEMETTSQLLEVLPIVRAP